MDNIKRLLLYWQLMKHSLKFITHSDEWSINLFLSLPGCKIKTSGAHFKRKANITGYKFPIFG